MRKRILIMALSLPLMIGFVTDTSFATCYGNDPCHACKKWRRTAQGHLHRARELNG